MIPVSSLHRNVHISTLIYDSFYFFTCFFFFFLHCSELFVTDQRDTRQPLSRFITWFKKTEISQVPRAVRAVKLGNNRWCVNDTHLDWEGKKKKKKSEFS